MQMYPPRQPSHQQRMPLKRQVDGGEENENFKDSTKEETTEWLEHSTELL